MTLKEKIQNLPTKSGVYQYFDDAGRLLYIGKAKVLKNRVKSYFSFTPTLSPSSKLSPRIYKMISEVHSLEYIIVANENDSLILENSLIKQLKPKYNILLRDDKTYPYIYIDYSLDFPRLEITRKVLKGKKIKYFGPYSTGAKDMLDSIYEIVPLVQKKSCLNGTKACLFYQIEKCYAPCENKISIGDYSKLIDEALSYIHNKTKLIKNLNIKMNFYSEQFRFEDAMVLRDRISTIKKSQIKSTLDFASNSNIDLFCIYITNHKALVLKMFIRQGKLISTSNSFINITDITQLDDIYKTVIINFYNQDLPTLPNEIVIAHDIQHKEELENFIYNKYNKKVMISKPIIGKKNDLIKLAIINAKELLKINNHSEENIYSDIKELFNLYKMSYRYEAFDNSHIMGQATVGSMIVWDDNKFYKDDYRLYNLNHKDEYHQMKEMLTRRVEKFDQNPAPDVWIIDGGKTLVNLAYDILQSVGVHIDVIGIAKEKIDAKANRSKGAAKDILYTLTNTYKLETSDKRLHFIQKLRDEVHRTAIGFHKKQKRKEDKQISLLQIKGIGEAKISKLIKYFGEFELIKKASISELEEVLNKKDAFTLKQYFQNELK
jgi:excinuclease ABC subunit C